MSPNDRAFGSGFWLSRITAVASHRTVNLPTRPGHSDSGFLHATARFPLRAVGRVIIPCMIYGLPKLPGRVKARTTKRGCETWLVKQRLVCRSLLNTVEPAGPTFTDFHLILRMGWLFLLILSLSVIQTMFFSRTLHEKTIHLQRTYSRHSE